MTRIAAAYRLVAAATGVGIALIAAGCGGGGQAAQPYTLAGTVKTVSGAPIVGATVAATIEGQSQPVAVTATSGTGEYALALAPATYLVEAAKAGYETQQKRVTITATQPNLSFNFVLTAPSPPGPPANLGGKVTGAAGGAPIEGAFVSATLTGQSTPTATTTTDGDGQYRFWVASGTYVIAVSAAGYADAQRTVVLGQGAANLGVNFALVGR